MANRSGKIDPPTCREDLVRKAAADAESFPRAFDWINDDEERRVTEDPRNRGFRADAIRELAREWILQGSPIRCAKETREGYKDLRHFHYDITIGSVPEEFPRGLYVEMELSCQDEDVPSVNLLNAHPP